MRQPYRSHWQVTASGKVIALGESEHQGDLSQITLSHRVVAIAANASGLGYWIAQSNGQVESFGDALKLDDLAEVAPRQAPPSPDLAPRHRSLAINTLYCWYSKESE